ncbi:hypothetical protein ACWGH7_12290 [Streptomyces cyaneofuscatus]
MIFFGREVLESAQKYARRRSWAVSRGQVFTGADDATAPDGRRGWSSARELVLAGRADGVVALTADVFSGEIDRYRYELAWLEQHFGFEALVVPETTGAQS